MTRKMKFSITLIVLLVIAGGLLLVNDYYSNLPERISQHETIILGQDVLVPGSEAAMRVVVRDTRDAAPLADAMVTVSLKPVSGGQAKRLFSGQTDELGTAVVQFTVPEGEEAQTLLVETDSSLGSDQIERTVQLERDFRILLSTDKPLYQPGQLIHLRALALSSFDQSAAVNQPVAITIADGKGNQVFRKNLTTSEYGVAAVDFQLAGEVNSGTYKITAEMGNTSSEKSVTVEYYQLPKFDVSLSTDKRFYTPGEHVVGTLDAAYFFGKDVAGGDVTIEGFTFDFQRTDEFSVQGRTDEQGQFNFEFDLPEYIVGGDLEKGIGRFYLQASVTDLAQQTESSSLSFPVAGSPLVIEAIPEGGQFRPGVENILYVLTSYPDGSPAETALSVQVAGQDLSAQSGDYGLAEVRFVPVDVDHDVFITARDEQGGQASRSFFFSGEAQEETVLLRPDRPAYQVGDTMMLSVLTSQSSGHLYIDMIREGQTVSTRAVMASDGQAQIAVDLTPDLYGTLEIHAYKILRSGVIVRDTRLVIVDEANELDISLNTGEEVYRPGETAALTIQTTDGQGAGAQAAVGLAIVDESVFALAQQDPGFAKLYFQLEQELLQPKYELHGFSIPELIMEEPASDPQLRQAQEGAAQASLADATPKESRFSMKVNSRDDNLQEAVQRQRDYIETRDQVLVIGIGGGILLLIVGGLVWVGRAIHWLVSAVLGVLLVAGAGLMFIVTSISRGGDMALFDDVMMDAPMEAGAVFEAEEMGRAASDTGADGEGAGGQQPPRLRQFFPETMLWLPDEVTDANGLLELEIPIADSITTWRMTALASTQDGRLGSTDAGLRVFQEFFVDLNLPQALTVGDELSVPVGVFNYLPNSQEVVLQVEEAFWFDLMGEAEQTISIASNDITVVYFPIRVKQFGHYPFTVTALGTTMSDAIQKPVRIFPDGKQIFFTESDQVNAETPAALTLTLPGEAINGSQALNVKIYPGMVSHVVEGLDSILQMPSGCFEQSSSTTYPNVLVMDYLQTSGDISPEVQFKAEDFINLGYQRLTTFEVDGGGFSLFGDAPASILLSAYAVQEFTDMSRVHAVDQDLISRTARWVLDQQNGEGFWGNDNTWVEGTFVSGPQGDPIITTAYVMWSLGRAGLVNDARFEQGLAYLQQKQADVDDPYTLGMVANALVEAENAFGRDGMSGTVLNRLAAMAQKDGDAIFWKNEGSDTFMGGGGDVATLEATALATLAFIRSGQHLDLVEGGVLYLVQNKDSFGNWQTTQTTILSLQTFIENAKLGSENIDATITISLGNQTRTVRATAENYDVMQMVSFEDVGLGQNEIKINVEGEGRFMYQVTGSYYLPWQDLPDFELDLGLEQAVTVDVAYDRTELEVDDSVNVSVDVSMKTPGARADWALVDLGVPPGFTVNSEDLSALVAFYDDIPEGYDQSTIERYELTGRQILVYIGNLSEGKPLSFNYRLTANYPLRAQTPASSAYDYYNPQVAGEDAPQLLVVRPEK
jgi:uncharacterized protein YfaS (alpha-2-macroglobulin family)